VAVSVCLHQVQQHILALLYIKKILQPCLHNICRDQLYKLLVYQAIWMKTLSLLVFSGQNHTVQGAIKYFMLLKPQISLVILANLLQSIKLTLQASL
jgi:hypothetical protein